MFKLTKGFIPTLDETPAVGHRRMCGEFSSFAHRFFVSSFLDQLDQLIDQGIYFENGFFEYFPALSKYSRRIRRASFKIGNGQDQHRHTIFEFVRYPCRAKAAGPVLRTLRFPHQSAEVTSVCRRINDSVHTDLQVRTARMNRNGADLFIAFNIYVRCIATRRAPLMPTLEKSWQVL